MIGTVVARALGLLALLTLPIAGSDAARAEYRLQAGDAVELSGLNLESLSRRATIDPDGMISLPLVGHVKAAGLTLTELRNQVGDLVSANPVRIYAINGEEVIASVGPEEINLTIAEYRPVYVYGDVTTPGAQAFRPGLTVRQAVAVAGGFGSARGMLDGVDAWSEAQSTRSALLREQLRLRELQALLADKPLPAPQTDETATGSASPLLDLAGKSVEAEREQLQRQRSFLKAVMVRAEGRIGTLQKQQSSEEEGARLDLGDALQTQDLHKRGVVPTSRYVEARRVSLLSSTRALQTSVEAEQASKDRDDYENQLLKLESERKSQLITAMQDNVVRIAELEAKLRGAEAKAVLSGGIGMIIDPRRAKKDIQIHRRSGDMVDQIAGTEDAGLQPGDTVEVYFERPDLIDLRP